MVAEGLGTDSDSRIRKIAPRIRNSPSRIRNSAFRIMKMRNYRIRARCLAIGLGLDYI